MTGLHAPWALLLLGIGVVIGVVMDRAIQSSRLLEMSTAHAGDVEDTTAPLDETEAVQELKEHLRHSAFVRIGVSKVCVDTTPR